MAQVFKRRANTYAKLSIFGAVFIVAGLLWGFAVLNRSDYATLARVAREQPVPFSHRHHVAGLGLDCRYCHTSVERSAKAGIPPTRICMNCHSQIWADAPVLEPVRASFRTGESLPWVKVHDLPDFVYFDHSIHIRQGVACEVCHGRVDTMGLTWQESSLQMEWCLDCHRNPAPSLRPREAVFEMGWDDARSSHGNGSDTTSQKVSDTVVAHVSPRVDCTTCHR